METEVTPTKGERTRAEITQAAYALFLEQGYNATSMRQIAERADIAPGGIYNHFVGKEEIFQAVFIERHPYLAILPLFESAPNATFEELVRHIAQRMIRELHERPDFLNLMFIEMIEFKGKHMPILIDLVLPRLTTFVQRGIQAQRNDELRDIPIPVLMRAFLGLFVSHAITEQLLSNLPDAFRTDSLDYFIDIFLHGIIKRAANGGAMGEAHV